jgi:hypothetical protein
MVDVRTPKKEGVAKTYCVNCTYILNLHLFPPFISGKEAQMGGEACGGRGRKPGRRFGGCPEAKEGEEAAQNGGGARRGADAVRGRQAEAPV